MDLSQLLALLMSGNNPWLLVAGALVPVILARLGIKLPLMPAPAPGPAPSPVPSPTGRPLLDALLKLLLNGGAKAASDVTTGDLLRARQELDAQLADRAKQADAIRAALTPEPARPL